MGLPRDANGTEVVGMLAPPALGEDNEVTPLYREQSGWYCQEKENTN